MARYSNGLEDSLDLPPASITVLEKRYLRKDSSGKILETGEDLYRRVAKDIAVADAFYLDDLKDKFGENPRKTPTGALYSIAQDDPRIKQREEEFFELMKNGYFMPNSPTLMNAGGNLQQLSACFVLPIEDSMEGIFNTISNSAMVHKSGGGTGFSFSRLRPNGAFIRGTGSLTPGPISFLKIYNAATDAVKQGGKRRGANMGVLRANHPDALDWAYVKQNPHRIENFNLSIAFTNEEIDAVKKEGYILMKDPREGFKYTLDNAKKRKKEFSFGYGDVFNTSWDISSDKKKIINTYTNEEIGKVDESGNIYLNARKFFDAIAELAWKTGDPGVIFIDKINEKNPTPGVGLIESTNPCGEQPLLPYESCNLGSINLEKMIKPKTEDSFFGDLDESLLEKTVRSAVRFLDNVIDRNRYPIPEIEEMTLANRKIGLGVMGFADYLAKRGIGYNEPEAINEAERVMKFINDISKDESKKLAQERGPFPNFEKSIYKNSEPIRNATTTTIAPTGTISIINGGVSQGIEPIFQLFVKRNVEKSTGKNLIEFTKTFAEYIRKKGLYDKEFLNKITQEETSENISLIEKVKREIEEKLGDEVKRLFPTANTVPIEQHLKIQAAFQKYTDNAVSKTINMPNKATPEDIKNAYLMAYELGCKGITIYRDGSREDQLLVSAESQKEKNLTEMERPDVIGTTIPQQTPHGKSYITLNVLESERKTPYEAFINIGKGGRDMAAIGEGFGRLTSLAFKYNVPLEEIVEQLDGIGGQTQIIGKEKITSLPDALAKGLREAYNKLNKKGGIKINNNHNDSFSGNFCSECGGPLIPDGNCEVCSNCGATKCG